MQWTGWSLVCSAKLFVCLVGFARGRPLRKEMIDGPPHLEKPLHDGSEVHIPVGTPVHRFECKLSKRNQPKSATTWYKSGYDIKDQPPGHFEVKSKGSVLLMRHFQLSDSGSEIGCKVTNEFGSVWRNLTITVISEDELMKHSQPIWNFKQTNPSAASLETEQATAGPPYFLFEEQNNPSKNITPSRNIEAPFGQDVLLDCPAIGLPVPKIYWLKDGVDITDRISGGENTGATFHIMNPRSLDSGNYTCVATNQYGSAPFTYMVRFQSVTAGPPLLESDYPKNATVTVGQSAMIECRFHSEPQPSVEWTTGIEINGTIYQKPLTDVDDKYDVSDPGRLIIRNTTLDDSGMYVCTLSNTYGSTNGLAHLAVQTEAILLPVTGDWLPIAVSCGALLTMMLIVIVLCRWKRHHAAKLAEKVTSGIPIQTFRKRIRLVQRRNSDHSANSILEQIFVEDVWQPAGSSFNSGSIVTSKATTISQCNSMVEYDLPYDEDWEYPREQLQDFDLEKPIGEGAFGKVIKAKAPNIRKDGNLETIVAVKTSKDTATEQEFIGLIGELEIMKAIGSHQNIINLLGCCTVGGPLYVIVEYAPNGNLRDFLRSHRRMEGYEQPIGIPHLSQRDLGRFAYEICRGMEYLSSKRVIHRDLAARNILVAENNIMKIADFGLAKDVYGQEYYRKLTNGRLPVKWMAPEALFDSLYTYKSDIWAFGVLLWEITTFGAMPYHSINDPEQLLIFLRAGRRMIKPANCTDDMYKLMIRCWQQSPGNRPSFTDLARELDNLLTRSDYLEISHEDHPILEVNPQYVMTPFLYSDIDAEASNKAHLLRTL